MAADIERLIRAAQERQAQRAVDPDRVREALPKRAARVARRKRYGTFGAVAVATCVAAAVAVPVLALRGGSHPPASPVGAPSPATGTRPGTSTGGDSVALGYRLTWLPPGFVERMRHVTFHPAVQLLRFWTSEPVGTDGRYGGDQSVSLSVRRNQSPTDPPNNGGTPVDVNGKVGYSYGTLGNIKSYVEWRIDAQTVVSVSQHGSVSPEDLLRIARSVQADPGQARIPLVLGWLPDHLTVNSGELSGDSPTRWMAALNAEELNAEEPVASEGGKQGKEGSIPRSVMASISPTTTAPAGGEELTVGGHPARLVKRTDIPELTMTYLVVDLGGGTLLTVLGHGPNDNPITRDDLIRIAEHATPGDPADASWVGTP